MSKVMKNRTDNDIKNKWNSMQRVEGRETIAAITAPIHKAARSYHCDYESTSWKHKAYVGDLFTTTPSSKPFLSTTSTPLDFSLQFSELGIPAVVTDCDDPHTTIRTGQFDWENRLRF
jgi:hypothetical protein